MNKVPVFVTHQQRKENFISKLNETGVIDLKKDVEDLLKANLSKQIRPKIWTRADLIRDFRAELKKPDYADEKATVVTALLTKAIETVANQGTGDPTSIIAKATSFVIDTVQKKALGEVVGYVVQNELEGKAAKKAVRSLGTKFILMSIAIAKGSAFTPAAPVGMLITYILYLHEKEREKQEIWNQELATILTDRLDEIRSKTQAKLDEKHRTEIERFLMSNIAYDTEEDSPFGYYTDKNNAEITLSIGDAAQLRDQIRANLSNRVTNADLILAASLLNLKPKPTQTLTLSPSQKKKLNDFAEDIVQSDYHVDMDEWQVK